MAENEAVINPSLFRRKCCERVVSFFVGIEHDDLGFLPVYLADFLEIHKRFLASLASKDGLAASRCNRGSRDIAG